MWSLGGALAKLLTQETVFQLNSPEIRPLTIAFYRVLFAGLVLIPTLQRADLTFRPTMLVMVASFATMNALYIQALTLGSAANAVLLQYTAPIWMYLASVWWLREPADPRGRASVVVGVLGIVIIVLGNQEEPAAVIAMGLGSGVAYAGIVICLRLLRDESSRWLTVQNHLFGALLILPWVWSSPLPSVAQLIVLAGYGTIQMAIPYWLVARGMRSVDPQEAGSIMLLEPLLNPLWAYLVSGERPPPLTFVGGACILGGLAWRYWPYRAK